MKLSCLIVGVGNVFLWTLFYVAGVYSIEPPVSASSIGPFTWLLFVMDTAWCGAALSGFVCGRFLDAEPIFANVLVANSAVWVALFMIMAAMLADYGLVDLAFAGTETVSLSFIAFIIAAIGQAITDLTMRYSHG